MAWVYRGKNALRMPLIDAHQHFWKFDPARDSWISGEMSLIQKDFIPVDLEILLQQHGVDGSVVVQSSQAEDENTFQLANADAFDFIKGVVGWVDFQKSDVDERLAHYHSFKKIKGFRHVLQGEIQRDLMLSRAFMNGIGKLEKYGFTYDILVLPDQLKYLPAFVSSFPNQKFVIDHIAKPLIRTREIRDWASDLQEIAQFENVYCKISGMLTEADWHHWQPDDFTPYLDHVVKVFGAKRIMYGSDWPVCLVAGSYGEQLNIARNYFSAFSQYEQELFFGGNATRFYNLR